MNTTRHSLLLSALLLSFFSLHFCRAQVIDLDPRHPEWVELPLTGEWWNDSLVRGDITGASIYSAVALGDIDNSGTDDFGLSVRVGRIDSTGEKVAGTELWIYKGTMNGLPEPRSYQRIGPTEFASNTDFLAAGDWDGDGDIDLCTDIRLIGDTSNGTTVSEIHRIVIFWNDGTSNFSLMDTTRLPNPAGLGNDVWGANFAHSIDFSKDGVEDLLIQGGGGRVNGEPIQTARMHLYHGVRGDQWGRNGVSAMPVWGWWKLPSYSRMAILDQNCDERPDLVFYYDGGRIGFPDLYIYYGNETTDRTGVPDTLDMEEFSFDSITGQHGYSLLSDVTSDNVPDLILTCEDKYFRVYAGLPGKRLSAVYGSGDDPADPENGYPDARPWAKVEMPGLLRDGSFSSPTDGPLFDLGDADLDGWNDLWTTWSTWEDGPNVVVYRTGPGFDMIIDARAYYGGELQHVGLLGDIDGTGNPTRVIINGYLGKQQIVQFIKSGDDLPTHAYDYPRTPPSGHKTFESTGNRCDGSVGRVSNDEFQVANLRLRIIPNPPRGEVRIFWETEKRGTGETEITVHDLSGAVVYRTKAEMGQNTFLWNTAGLPTGVYYVTLTIGTQQQTVKVIIE